MNRLSSWLSGACQRRLIQGSVLLGFWVLAMNPSLAPAESLTYTARAGGESQLVKLTIGKSMIIDVPVSIKRASLANPNVADAIVLSPRQIYVTGKGFGVTNLTLWGKDEQVLTIFDIDINLDISRLQEQLRAVLPDETLIHVVAAHDHVMLSGFVSNAARQSQVLAMAEAYAPKRVLNFLNFVRVEPAVSAVPSPPVVASAVLPPPVTVEVIKGVTVSYVTPK